MARLESLRVEEELRLRLAEEEKDRLARIEDVRVEEEKKMEDLRKEKIGVFVSLKGTDQVMHIGSVTCQGGDSLVSP